MKKVGISYSNSRNHFECCKRCANRSVGCHGICKDYISAKKEAEEEKILIAKERTKYQQ
jgi:hypothetical protein